MKGPHLGDARPAAPRRVGFGPFLLDLSDGSLLRGDNLVHLAPVPFKVLACLVRRAGKLTTKEALLDEVWPGTHVTDQSLIEAISVLRQALGDSPQSPVFVETVHRRGYRFIAPLSSVDIDSDGVLRLAVMPLTDLSPEGDQRYFCNGIVEELLATLANHPAVRVPAPASVFAIADDANVLTVGKLMGADLVLEGAVRKAGSDLAVSVRFTRTSDATVVDSVKCSGSVDEALSIQEDLSRRVLRVLDLGDAHEPGLIRNHSTDLTAYDLYLMSRHYWNKRTVEGLRSSIALGEQAVQRDPAYGLAHATVGLANAVLASYSSESPQPLVDRGRAAALAALEVDSSLAEAYAALGLVYLGFDWDWGRAEEALGNALRLAPRDATTHCWLGFWHLAMDDGRRALHCARAAEELEPSSLILRSQVAWVLYFLRDFEGALEQLDGILRNNPRFWRAYLNAGWCHIELGNHEEAIAAIETAVALNEYPLLRAVLARAYARAGRRRDARALLDRLMEDERFLSPYFVALAYLGLDEGEVAIRWLRRAVEQREWFLVFALHDPGLDPLRGTAPFREVMREVGLPPH